MRSCLENDGHSEEFSNGQVRWWRYETRCFYILSDQLYNIRG